MDLKNSREEINKIDIELTQLFERRMDVALLVAEYKQKNSLPIFDSAREKIVLEKNINLLKNKKYEEYLKTFFISIMGISKDYQKTIFKFRKKLGYQLGYQGVEGSFGQQAAGQFLKEDGGDLLPFKEFDDVFFALEDEKIDYGVLPVENSSTGIINQNYDLLQKSNMYIVNETVVRAKQNLLGIKDSSISDIKKVYSHIQGFEQSRFFLKDHDDWELIPYFNTATSAKFISEKNNAAFGAIASLEAAKIYGLDVLAKNINDNANNFTRFIKVSRNLEYDSNSDKISLVFSIKNEKNSLLNILNILSNYNINMLNLQSRPVQNKPWEYLFYLDILGNLKEEKIIECLEEIEDKSLFYKLLGCYRREVF